MAPVKFAALGLEQGFDVESDGAAVSRHDSETAALLAQFWAGKRGPIHCDSVGSRAPLISVILPAHNGAPCIRETVRSNVGQQFQQWEPVVVDDCNGDTIGDVVVPSLRNGRIISVRQEHRGHSTARNPALAIARGSTVTYFDSD
ncbi:hypothetical protein BH11PSE4_BH11PSE4_35030 [soil metagenome]